MSDQLEGNVVVTRVEFDGRRDGGKMLSECKSESHIVMAWSHTIAFRNSTEQSFAKVALTVG